MERIIRAAYIYANPPLGGGTAKKEADMGFFESLKQQFPEVVAHNSKSPAAKKKKHPRSEVLELIDHSIRYLENPNFKVKDRPARHRRWK